MTREWKPGDVARLTFTDGSTAIGVRNRTNDGWEHAGAFGGGSAFDSIGAFEARPLVAIDPGDREQVERFVRRLADDRFWAIIPADVEGIQYRTEQLQAALREFANPTPPKPEEPLGLGAVVEDAEGQTYVRVTGSDHEWPWSGYLRKRLKWSEISAVRVLSEGVEVAR